MINMASSFRYDLYTICMVQARSVHGSSGQTACLAAWGLFGTSSGQTTREEILSRPGALRLGQRTSPQTHELRLFNRKASTGQSAGRSGQDWEGVCDEIFEPLIMTPAQTRKRLWDRPPVTYFRE